MKRILLLFCAIVLALGANAQAIGDQISFGSGKYTVVGENLFINGSFDDGVNGWKTIDYTTDAVESDFNLSSEGGFDGGAFLTTNGAGVGAATTIRQSMAVEAGKTYYFCVYTSGKAPSSNNFNYNALFKMKNATTEDGVLKAFEWPQGADQTTDQWNKTEFVFTADEAHPYVGVRMGWNSQTSFDGFTLVEIEEAGIDLTALNEAITEAETELTKYDAGSEGYDILSAAIATAKAATPTTLEEMNNIISALKKAISDARMTIMAKFESGSYTFQNVGANNEGAKSFMGQGNSWGTQGSLLEYAIFTDVTALEDGRYELDLHASNNQNLSARLNNELFADGGLPGTENVAIQIYPKGEGYVLTFDGENYVCYDGETSVLKTTTDSESENALWTITSKQEILDMISAMKEGDEPIEITGLIKDPGFNRHNYDTYAKQSWTETHTGGDFKLSSGDNSAAGGANWNMQQWNGDFDLYQTLEVPVGKYKMTVQGFYRDGNADVAGDRYSTGEEIIRGYIYANESEKELVSIFSEAKEEQDDANGFTTETSSGYIPNSQAAAGLTFAAGYYVNELDEILVTDGTLKIGAKNPAHGENDWVVLKNFRLWYIGPSSDLGNIALANAIDKLEPYVDNFGDANYYYSEATYDAAEDLLGEANGILSSSTGEDCLVEAEKVNAMITTIVAEIADYKNLNVLVSTVRSDKDKYSTFSSIKSELTDMYETYYEAYDEASATSEQIKGWVAGYSATLRGLVKAAMSEASVEKQLDITVLYDNMNAASTADWTCTSSEFKANNNTYEVWNKSFDCNRTFADLPKGTYNIEVKAFQRYGNSTETCDASDQDITTYIYAGMASVKVKNLSEALSENKDHEGYAEIEGYGYLPNTQAAARYYFDNTPETFLTKISANILDETGNLVIGIKNDVEHSNNWSVWADWTILYAGVSAEGLFSELQSLITQAEGILNSGVVNSEAAYSKVHQALESAKAISAESGETAILDAMNNLKDAIDYFNNGLELIKKIGDLIVDYENLTEGKDASGTELETIYNDLVDAQNDDFSSTDNEQMEGWIEAYAAARVDFILGDLTAASAENPIDITAIIVNPTMEGEKEKPMSNGWTAVNMVHQNNKDYQAWDDTTNALMVNDDEEPVYGFQGFAQNWTSSNDTSIDDSSIKQTINKLPAGAYKLGAFAIATSGSASLEVSGATLFANNESVNIDKNVYGADGSAYPHWYEVVVCLEEGENLTIGADFKAGYVKWFGIDNVKLWYMGTDTSAVEEVQTSATTAPAAIYSIDGVRRAQLQRGINIVRKTDGTTVKVLVK